MRKHAAAVRRYVGSGGVPRIKSTYTLDNGAALRVKLLNGAIELIVPAEVLVELAHEVTVVEPATKEAG